MAFSAVLNAFSLASDLPGRLRWTTVGTEANGARDERNRVDRPANCRVNPVEKGGVEMPTKRPPAVAGMFYPENPRELASLVEALLLQADDTPGDLDKSRAVMAPHAGYVYSGATAAAAYQALAPAVRRVAIFGPTHRVGIQGMALTGADFQETPLGLIETDAEITCALEDLPSVITAPVVHAQEHSIEVHLPFLQRYLEEGFTVIPVAVGLTSPEEVAEAISTVLSFPDTAVIISSDLSHFLSYDQARRVDAQTLAQILAGGPALVSEQACGVYPVNGMMHYASDHGLAPQLIDACNSGDTAGDKNRVVGYAAVAWNKAREILAEDDEGKTADTAETEIPEEGAPDLLAVLAYNAIADKLGAKQRPIPSDKDAAELENTLTADGAAFVTLNLDGSLRGCIGSLVAHRPLGEDIVANAQAAAFQDPRFAPLTPAEFNRIDLEVSVLSQPVPLWDAGTAAPPESEVLAALRPGVDGAVLSFGPYRATYLPQVWEQLPQPSDFLNQLKLKAGLPSDFWDPRIQVETYQVEEHHLTPSGEHR